MKKNPGMKNTRKNQIDAEPKMDPYRIIFEKSSDVLLIIGGEKGTIIEVNQAIEAILGYKRKGLIGKPFSTLFSSDSHTSKKELMQNITVYGNVFVQEFRCADGSICIMDLTATMIPWENDSAILVTLRDVSERVRYELDREKLINELRKAMENIKALKGLVPICLHCKKIRNDEGFWQQVEVYVQEHSTAHFSHGVCPSCLKKYYPQYYKDEDEST